MMMSLPLTVILIYTVYSPWRMEREKLVANLFWGLKAFIPGILLYLIGIQFLRLAYRPVSLFVFFLIQDYLLWFFLALAGYAVLYSTRYKDYPRKSSELLGYLAGFFLLAGVVDTLMRFGNYNVYSLFMLPLLRISMILWIVSIMGLLGKQEGKIQYFIPVPVLLLTLPGGAAAMLFSTSHPAFAWLVTMVYLAGSLALFIFLSLFKKS